MATQRGGKKLPAKTSLPSSDYYIPPLPVAVAPVRQSVKEDIVGWVAACILIALLLPMGALLYVDILEAKKLGDKLGVVVDAGASSFSIAEVFNKQSEFSQKSQSNRKVGFI